MFTLNCRGKILVTEKPLVMGILNITPDSFYEGSRFNESEKIVEMVSQMLKDGADIIDVGGQSTRPKSNTISAVEELSRVIPVIKLIMEKFPDAIFSIDTFYSEVARQAIDHGASIVNDISAGEMDKNMITTVAELKVPYIAMHMKGRPENMQSDPVYDNVVTEVFDQLSAKVHECNNAGINDIIIDPGFGFGKTISHNLQLLDHLELLRMINRPVLVGLSRKSTIYKILGIDVSDALNGTTVLNTVALMKGASILRVHDVKEAVQAVKLISALNKKPTP